MAEEADTLKLSALMITQAQQEIAGQLALLADFDAKLGAIVAGALALVALIVDKASSVAQVNLAIGIALGTSAIWGTLGLFSRSYRMGPDPWDFFSKCQARSLSEAAASLGLLDQLEDAVETNTAKLGTKARAFNASGLTLLVSGVVMAATLLSKPVFTIESWKDSLLFNGVVTVVLLILLAGAFALGVPPGPPEPDLAPPSLDSDRLGAHVVFQLLPRLGLSPPPSHMRSQFKVDDVQQLTVR